VRSNLCQAKRIHFDADRKEPKIKRHHNIIAEHSNGLFSAIMKERRKKTQVLP
jgi:hypothetical protein